MSKFVKNIAADKVHIMVFEKALYKDGGTANSLGETEVIKTLIAKAHSKKIVQSTKPVKENICALLEYADVQFEATLKHDLVNAAMENRRDIEAAIDAGMARKTMRTNAGSHVHEHSVAAEHSYSVPRSTILFTSIPVPTALDVINCLFCEHIEDPEAKHKYVFSFKCNTIGLEKDEAMQLLKLVLENCVFTFQDKFFKQLHSATMGSPCSPVVANIYMEYFEDLALGPELPIPVKDWKRYVDDVFSIIPKGNRDTMLQYLNSIDPHIKFTIEQPNEEGGIPFLDTFPKPQGEGIAVSVYRKPTHMDRYLDFNSSHPISAKRAVVRALMD